VLDSAVEATFYVHYELVRPTVTDNDTVGQWWLSRGDMTRRNRLGFCEEDDLRDCVANTWNVRVIEQGADGADGTIFNLLDEFSAVRDGDCDSHFAAASKDGGLSTEAVVAAVGGAVTLCFVVAVVAALCFWRRLQYEKYRNDASRVQHSVFDAEEAHAVSPADGDGGDETTEISVDLSVVDAEITI